MNLHSQTNRIKFINLILFLINFQFMFRSTKKEKNNIYMRMFQFFPIRKNLVDVNQYGATYGAVHMFFITQFLPPYSHESCRWILQNWHFDYTFATISTDLHRNEKFVFNLFLCDECIYHQTIFNHIFIRFLSLSLQQWYHSRLWTACERACLYVCSVYL